MTSRLHELFRQYGSIVGINAYAPVALIPLELRNQLQLGGVQMIDASALQGSGRKDVVDKLIFTALFVFALDHRPPATIVLISGDVDYAVPLATLKLRGYNTILVPPKAVSRALLNIPSSVVHWTSVVTPAVVNPIELRVTTTEMNGTVAALATSHSPNSAVQEQHVDEPSDFDLETQSDWNPLCTEIDLLDVCLEYHESGNRTTLLASRAGELLQSKYPQGFRKGILSNLVPQAMVSGWLSTKGTGGQYTLVLNPTAMQLAWDQLQMQLESDSDIAGELEEVASLTTSSSSLFVPPSLFASSSGQNEMPEPTPLDSSPPLLALLDVCLEAAESGETSIRCSKVGTLLRLHPRYTEGTKLSPLIDEAIRHGWANTSGVQGTYTLEFRKEQLLFALRRYELAIQRSK